MSSLRVTYNLVTIFNMYPPLFFLVHLDQRLVQVNYCHHLASVVCKLFTFQAFSPKPLGLLEPNLAGMFLGWSSTKLLFFVPVGYSTWLPGPIICSVWLKFQRSSSLKLMNWLNPNCKRMIIGMSFSKFLFFMPIGNPRWPPPQVFCSDMKFKMAVTAGLSLTLDPMGIFFQNTSSLKRLGQLKPNCSGMIIGRSSTYFLFLCRSEIQDGHQCRT